MGEYRWLWELERTSRVISNRSHGELLRVADEWIAARMNIPPDDVAAPRKLAEMYSQFLSESIDTAEVNPPPWEALESARRRWCERSGS